MSLWETESGVVLEFDVPGVKSDQIELSIERGVLSVRVDRKAPEVQNQKWLDERRYGQFERAVSLPESIDPGSVDASLEDGVLKVTLQRKAEAQPQKIMIQTRGQSAEPTCIDGHGEACGSNGG